jgi:carbon monoxide dehydrogenase subunit G
MAEGQVEIGIDAPLEAVWALVGDFGAVDRYLGGIDSLRLEGDERVIGMFGMEIRERLVGRDEDAHSITYALVGGLELERHQATITVSPDGEGVRVTWGFEVVPDEMAPIFADTYQKGLDSLRAHFA